MSKDTVALKLEVLRVMGDTSDESVYKYGYQISKRLFVEMIADCDVFFHLFDSERRKGLTKMSVDSLSKAVNDAKPKVGEKPNGQYYFTLGVLNARQEKWSDGLAAFEEALKLDPLNEAYRFFKALALENLGRFDESILLYEQLAVKFNKPEYFIISAIVKRLKAEKVK
jgi:tetratricopeptide (TPR) repeat protein